MLLNTETSVLATVDMLLMKISKKHRGRFSVLPLFLQFLSFCLNTENRPRCCDRSRHTLLLLVFEIVFNIVNW